MYLTTEHHLPNFRSLFRGSISNHFAMAVSPGSGTYWSLGSKLTGTLLLWRACSGCGRWCEAAQPWWVQGDTLRKKLEIDFKHRFQLISIVHAVHISDVWICPQTMAIWMGNMDEKRYFSFALAYFQMKHRCEWFNLSLHYFVGRATLLRGIWGSRVGMNRQLRFSIRWSLSIQLLGVHGTRALRTRVQHQSSYALLGHSYPHLYLTFDGFSCLPPQKFRWNMKGYDGDDFHLG